MLRAACAAAVTAAPGANRIAPGRCYDQAIKPKTLRYLASVTVVPLAFEVLPHAPEADEDCAADVMINLCSANRDPWATEPRNLHALHRDCETGTGRALEWVMSGGMVASTSTGPTIE
jgi:hypothetical protein